jgi:PilZ domain
VAFENVPKPQMTIELRRATRHPIVASVEVRERRTNVMVRARTSDLSTVGCYVDTLNPLPASTDVELRISYNDEIVTIRGAVAYAKANMGMGIEFVEMQVNQLKVLQKWLDEIKRSPLTKENKGDL